jgi:hypothetical protein
MQGKLHFDQPTDRDAMRYAQGYTLKPYLLERHVREVPEG